MATARELSSRLLDLLRREQSAMADFLVALSVFDRERRWVELGHSSLFYFLHRELGLSAGAALYRKTAAELIQRYPELVEPLRDGRLCLTTVAELAKVISPENRADVLPRFFHASKQEAKAVAAELAPREAAPHRAVVTALALAPSSPASMRETGTSAEGAPPPALDQAFRPDETGPRPSPELIAPAPTAPPRTSAEPLTADLRRLHVTVSKRFLEKLAAARNALSHSHPGADEEEILEAGLDLLIARAAARKGIVASPRGTKPPPSSNEPPLGGAEPAHQPRDAKAIPAAVRREVWIRDGGRCQWSLDSGGICGSTQRIQFDHIVPRARGGGSTTANLRLCCQFHNLLAARRSFGDEWMNRFTRAGRSDASSAAQPA
jgi:hypothetical protein